MKDIHKFLSRSALSREPSPIRAIGNYLLSLPPDRDVLSLAGGNPAPSTFPLESLYVTLKSGQSLKLDGAVMAAALQYNATLGQNRLVKFWTSFINKEIRPAPGPKRGTIVTTGAEFGSYLALNALCDPGDSVIVSQPTYPPITLKARALGVELVGVPEDSVVGGLCPTSLDQLLDTWPTSKPKPKVLAVCPTGSNPSGANIPAEHRERIYRAMCRHDMLLLEDDPYYFINYGPSIPTFLTLDTEGRVLRLDSLSKVLCPGLRVGFLTVPSTLTPYMEMHYSVALINSSNVSQAIAMAYFDEVGVEGLMAHSREIAGFYREQRDILVSALDKHMADLGSWVVPQAGMFIWVKLETVSDTSKLAPLAMDQGVAFVPGVAFSTDNSPSPYIRLAFSQIPGDRIEEAVIRLADIVRQYSGSSSQYRAAHSHEYSE